MGAPRWSVPAVHVPLFLALSLGWMVVVNVVLVGFLLYEGGVVDPAEVLARLGPAGMGAFTMLQMGGLALLAVGLATFLPAPADWTTGSADPAEAEPWTSARGAVRSRVGALLSAAFPLRVHPLWIAVAVLGALTIWTMPSFIAQELTPLLPGYESTNALVSRMLREASLGGRLVMILAVVASAPLLEELIFRGYLWRAIEIGLGRWAALVGTTLLFAVFHLDPIQAVALLPIALLLGWLRLESGSLVPSMATHLINNGFGVVVTLVSADDEGEMGLPLALGGLVATAIVAAVGAWLSRRWAGSAP